MTKRLRFLQPLAIALFYPMLFLRKPFLAICNVLVGLLFIGFILSLIFGMPISAKICFISFSFILFLIGHFYDIILLKLNPTGSELTLQN